MNEKILTDIIPYLKLKRKHAEMVLDGIEIMERRKPPFTLPKENVLKLMQIIEGIRKLCGSHRRREVKWTYEVVKRLIEKSGFHSEERMNKHTEHLRSIGKRGHHFPKGNISWNKTNSDKEKKIVEAYKKGTHIKDIVEKEGIKEQTVYKILRRNDIQPSRKKRYRET